jgi:cryptochrome
MPYIAFLNFGALSCRYTYHRTEEILAKRRKAKQALSEVPTSLHGQILFRDMYFAAQAALGFSFGQTYNNPECRFIPRHLPSKVDTGNGLVTGGYEVDSEEAEA